MKKIAFIALLLVAACNPVKKDQPKLDLKNTEFIYLENKRFKYKGNDYFPMMMNYVINFKVKNNELFPLPARSYGATKKFTCNSANSCLDQLKTHFKLINEMGFNTIRIAGFDHLVKENKDQHFIKAYNNKKGWKLLPLKEYKEKYIGCIQNILHIAEEAGLRVMIILQSPIDNDELEDLAKSILNQFSNNSTLFAYDFFNEPLYFDEKKQKRKKEEAYEIVCEWEQWMDEYAPKQLFTIGYSEPIEVFEWDPSILPVDFVAFHTYHPLRIPNEIYWYTKYVDKPWMIGETSLPADDDSISFEEQRLFLRETLKRIVDCGGLGFGWWQFQDVQWGVFRQDYKGLLTNKGKTKTKDSLVIYGTLKPAAKEIINFKKPKSRKNDCPCMPNYYNMLGYNNIVLKGKIINDDTGKPIEGAVIRGWSKHYKIGVNTFSDPSGNFSLYSNVEMTHFAISAPGMEKIKFSYKAEYKPLDKNITSMDSLKNRYLHYKQISYQPFLKKPIDSLNDAKTSDDFIFEFKKDRFHNAKFKGSMGERKLEPLSFIK